MTLSRRIARLELDAAGTPTCVCPGDTPQLREAAERRFVDALIRRRRADGPLVCPVCGRVRSSRCPADVDIDAAFGKLRHELELAERLAGVVPGPRESFAERLRRLLAAETEPVWQDTEAN